MSFNPRNFDNHSHQPTKNLAQGSAATPINRLFNINLGYYFWANTPPPINGVSLPGVHVFLQLESVTRSRYGHTHSSLGL
ncbi:MAG: hypothetical protein ACYCY3_07750 [Halothiobacillus sp.]